MMIHQIARSWGTGALTPEMMRTVEPVARDWLARLAEVGGNAVRFARQLPRFARLAARARAAGLPEHEDARRAAVRGFTDALDDLHDILHETYPLDTKNAPRDEAEGRVRGGERDAGSMPANANGYKTGNKKGAAK